MIVHNEYHYVNVKIASAIVGFINEKCVSIPHIEFIYDVSCQ